MTSLNWRATAAPGAALVVTVLLLGAGLVAARPDVALLGLPLAAVVARTLTRRSGPARPAVRLEQPRASAQRFDVALAVETTGDADMVELRLALLGGPSIPLVVAAEAASIPVTLPVLHSGPQQLLHLDHRLLRGDGRISAPAPALSHEVVVAPASLELRPLPLPHRLRGLTGPHESARPGVGGDFRDLHPFAPGDRVRRIDWKATARLARHPGELYVRRTAATSDTAVCLVLDSRDDLGELFADWGVGVGPASGTSSLDLLREAAHSVAAAYLDAGDRVGLHDLGTAGHLPAGAGRRHAHRLLRAIEITRPAAVPLDVRSAPALTPGALVVVCSTFLDDGTPRHCARWRGAGHRVIAIDVLPNAVASGASRSQRLAHRILLAERQQRLAQLSARGVEVFRWADDLPQSRAARWRLLAGRRRGSR